MPEPSLASLLSSLALFILLCGAWFAAWFAAAAPVAMLIGRFIRAGRGPVEVTPLAVLPRRATQTDEEVLAVVAAFRRDLGDAS